MLFSSGSNLKDDALSFVVVDSFKVAVTVYSNFNVSLVNNYKKMTRGNQREIDRARAAARNSKKPQTKESGQNQVNRKMTDAEIMRDKQRRAELKA